jgi:glycerol-3-phosphate acyltransferase PlsX
LPSPVLISLDAMGGDHGPSVVVPGVREYIRRHGGENVRFLLHGDETAIAAEMAKCKLTAGVCEIRHTDKVVAMDEKPAQAMRRGKGSSLWNAVESVKSGEAGAVVSAGNTGALMAISKLILRMSAPGLERPAIVASWPTLKGVTAVLDVGANIESDAEQLIEFAIMGEAFHAAVHGVKTPTIGILNVGSEDMKGHEEVREAHQILKAGGLDLELPWLRRGRRHRQGHGRRRRHRRLHRQYRAQDRRGHGPFHLVAAEGGPDLQRPGEDGRPDRHARAQSHGPEDRPQRHQRRPPAGPERHRREEPRRRHAKGFGNAIRIGVDLARSDYLATVGSKLGRLGDILHALPSAAAPTPTEETGAVAAPSGETLQ